MYFLPGNARSGDRKSSDGCVLAKRKDFDRKLLSGNDAFYAWCPKIIQKVGLNTLMLPSTGHVSCRFGCWRNYRLWIMNLIHINKTVWKLKNTEPIYSRTTFGLWCRWSRKFFYLILEKHQLKRIDLALDPELIFRKGIGSLEFYLRAAEARDSYSIL
jgi:hypothetical protein